MDRTVPKTGTEEIQLYMRTYYSLLRSTHAIQIETLVETHLAMDSSLHVQARSNTPDVSALIYSSLRMPRCVAHVDTLLLGQLEKSFVDADYPVTRWERVTAPGRRRRMHYDGDRTLAIFVASRSDIDDLIPILTAYQIEWNKLHVLLQGEVAKLFLAQHRARSEPLNSAEWDLLAGALHMEPDDVRRIEVAWGSRFVSTLEAMASRRKQFSIRQLAGSLTDYRRAVSHWWNDLAKEVSDHVDLESRPIYFVSSNTHSLINLLTGFAIREETQLIAYIEAAGHEQLREEYNAVNRDKGTTHKYNFLYYILKKYLRDAGTEANQRLANDERTSGIYRIPSRHGFDVEAQVIDLQRLRPDWIDPRVSQGMDLDWLTSSNAVILNIDYPLGLAAYEILSSISEHVAATLGIYVMGKAATLNGRIGDVMISNVVHDEHSQNTYLFNNCFTAGDVAPFLTYGGVFDNQKAISALGTFLQNSRYMASSIKRGTLSLRWRQDRISPSFTRCSARRATRKTRSSTFIPCRSMSASCITLPIPPSQRGITSART